MLAVDEGDRRLEDRQTPVQRMGRRLVRVAPLVASPLQPGNIVSRVAPLPRRSRTRLGSNEAAAAVGVKGGAAHPQRAGGVGGAQPLAVGIHVDSLINVDSIIHGR